MTGGPLLRLVARPWVDPLCLWGLKQIFPTSRAWAAANASDGDPERFAAALTQDRVPSGMASKLRRTTRLGAVSEAAFQNWSETVFGGAGNVADAEGKRRAAANAWSANRFSYFWFAKRRHLPAADLKVPTPTEAMAEFESAMNDPDLLFRLPDRMPEMERSRANDLGDIIEYWLRFQGPAGDTVFAHVYEPRQAPAGGLPSLILGHGFAVETEMMKDDLRGYAALARRGFRLIMPDAPGHNRRVVSGLYGGESFIMAPPSSGLRHLVVAAKEFGILAAWCRAHGSKRVAFGGISMGALTSQVAASRMGTWPAEARPDALLLITTTDRVSTLAFDSALAVITGLDVAARAKGWRAASFTPLAGIVDASPAPPVDPDRIVLLIGERDTVTPIEGGKRLSISWRVPANNLFLRDQGHFSAAFGLGVDPSPFRRIAEILAG